MDATSLFRMHNLPKGSVSWNFIVKCRALISKYITWDTRRGEDALFWEDSWDGLPPMDSLGILTNVKNTLVNLWGTKVSNFKYLKEENET